MNDIGEIIKLLAKYSVEQDKPVAVVAGRVVNDNYLSIETEQKLVVNEDFLIVPKRLKNHPWEIDERVIMLRCDGGQRYLVLDLI